MKMYIPFDPVNPTTGIYTKKIKNKRKKEKVSVYRYVAGISNKLETTSMSSKGNGEVNYTPIQNRGFKVDN